MIHIRKQDVLQSVETFLLLNHEKNNFIGVISFRFLFC